MGVLDRQSLRGDLRNRKVGRARIEARQARPDETDEIERRRPQRGLPRGDAPSRRPISARPTWVGGVGRAALFVLLFPLWIASLALRPARFVTMLAESPSRVRALSRRLRRDARDPDTAAGRGFEFFQLAFYFVRQEVEDMREGFPAPGALRRSLRTGFDAALEGIGMRFGIRPARLDETVGSRLLDAARIGVAAGVLGLALFLAAFGGIEALKASDDLEIGNVVVAGLERVSESALRAAIGSGPGDNLLAVDPPSVEAKIAALAWVRKVDVRRDLRARILQVRVTEHRPALLVLGHPIGVVSDAGAWVKELAIGEVIDAPLLSVGDSAPDDATIRGALDVLHALSNGRRIAASDISEIRADADGYTVVTRRGLPIVLGREDFASRLSRVERAIERGGLPLDALRSVNAALRDRLVAIPRDPADARGRLREAVDAQATAPDDRARLVHLERIRRLLGAGSVSF